MQLYNFLITHHRKYSLLNSDVLVQGIKCRSVLDGLYATINQFKETDRDMVVLNKGVSQ